MTHPTACWTSIHLSSRDNLSWRPNTLKMVQCKPLLHSVILSLTLSGVITNETFYQNILKTIQKVEIRKWLLVQIEFTFILNHSFKKCFRCKNHLFMLRNLLHLTANLKIHQSFSRIVLLMACIS